MILTFPPPACDGSAGVFKEKNKIDFNNYGEFVQHIRRSGKHMSSIKITSDIRNHWLWGDARWLMWWTDLMLMVEDEDREIAVKGHLFTLRRGETIASSPSLAKRWGVSKNTVIQFLRLLEEKRMIKRRLENGQIGVLKVHDVVSCIKWCSDDTTDVKVFPNGTPYVKVFSNGTPDCTTERPTNRPVQSPINQVLTDAHSVKVFPNGTPDCTTQPLLAKEKDKEKENLSPHTPLLKEKDKEKEKPSPSSRVRACARKGEGDAHEATELLRDESWGELMRMRWKMTRQQLEEKIEEFIIDCQCRGKPAHYNLSDVKNHFNSWLMINTNINQRQNNGRDNNNTASTPEQRRREAEELMLRLLNGDGSSQKDDDIPF